MIDRQISSISKESVKRGGTSQKMTVTWRHYISGISTYTLYDTSVTTAFPYPYGNIPVPFDAYFTSMNLVSSPWSSQQFPNGSSVTLSVYADNILIGSKAQTHGNNVRESVVFDFNQDLQINKNQVVTLRLQVNGQWWYCATTSLITER
tara:strand:- start:158 stop:604 length:447 start_codon:yes stop_codon:yes gene_type:complete